jgi:hypothetical protein
MISIAWRAIGTAWENMSVYQLVRPFQQFGIIVLELNAQPSILYTPYGQQLDVNLVLALERAGETA